MRQIDLVRENSDSFDRALERAYNFANSGTGLEGVASAFDESAEVLQGRRPEAALSSAEAAEAYSALEAIILADLRPAYLIENDWIIVDRDFDHVDLLTTNRVALETAAKSVGRVDLRRHPNMPFAGTGWLIDDDIVVTNSHVAQLFAKANRDGGYTFAHGTFDEPIEVRLDTVRQNEPGDVGRRAVDVTDILYVAADREPDIAFLKVVPRPDLPHLLLSTEAPESGLPIAAIGYPAWDGGRNDPALMQSLFRGIYNVKRFSPGLVNRITEGGSLVLSDYTSLGGSSGSAVTDLASGHVVGLHFAGVFRDTNYAVAASIVAAAKRRLATRAPGHVFDEDDEPPPTAAETFAGRKGYNPDFLGKGDLSIPLPVLSKQQQADLAPVDDNEAGHITYTHFTVLQSRSRRFPMLTAVNIDGTRAFRSKRQGRWRLDGRLLPKHQVGSGFYRLNSLRPAQMVRRRDPGWGETQDEAQQGEIDTFHWTNCAPQHADLGLCHWMGVEDYLLEAAETRGFKMAVFAGPIFRETDRPLRLQFGSNDVVAIPEEFWKIAAIVRSDDGELSATGYVLSHGPFIRDLATAGFVLGAYETYQVKITLIEAATGFDFGRLRDADPLTHEPDEVFGHAALRIEGGHSLRLLPAEATNGVDLSVPERDGPGLGVSKDTSDSGLQQMATMAGLQRRVRTDLGYLNLQRFNELARAVCRLEHNRGHLGTGFLVGPEAVLTNWHVVEDVYKAEALGEVSLHFDYMESSTGAVSEGMSVPLAARDTLIDHSPYSPAERTGTPLHPEPKPDELDYALLRLARPITERGQILLPSETPDFRTGQPIVIVQHPHGGPMKLAIDPKAIIGPNENETRIRYSTNTDPGSSGSPCVDLDGRLVALHHLGDPAWFNPEYNQGIPAHLIRRRLAERGFDDFLSSSVAYHVRAWMRFKKFLRVRRREIIFFFVIFVLAVVSGIGVFRADSRETTLANIGETWSLGNCRQSQKECAQDDTIARWLYIWNDATCPLPRWLFGDCNGAIARALTGRRYLSFAEQDRISDLDLEGPFSISTRDPWSVYEKISEAYPDCIGIHYLEKGPVLTVKNQEVTCENRKFGGYDDE